MAEPSTGSQPELPGSLTSPVDRVRSFVAANRAHGVKGIVSYEYLPLDVLEAALGAEGVAGDEPKSETLGKITTT